MPERRHPCTSPWNELRRARGRFGLLVAAVALLVFLILTQQTLQAGLIDSFVGGIRSQSAAVLVLTVDGRKNLAASVITPDLQQAITAVPGVGASGRFGSRSLNVTAGGAAAQAALVGYDEGAPGAPTTVTAGRAAAAPGEVVASDTAGAGFGLGERVRIEPGGYEVTVVGQASDAQLQASPTLYGLWATYDQAVRSSNPDARSPLPSAVAVDPAAGHLRRPAGHRHQRGRARRRRPHQGGAGRLQPRRRPDPPVVPGDLRALRPGHPPGDRPVLPHRDVPEGRFAHPAASPGRARRPAGALAARPGGARRRRRRRRGRPALPAPVGAEAGQHRPAPPDRRHRLLGGAAGGAGAGQRAAVGPPGAAPSNRSRPRRERRDERAAAGAAT